MFITEKFPSAREWEEANLYQEVWVIINKNDSHQVKSKPYPFESKCYPFESKPYPFEPRP